MQSTIICPDPSSQVNVWRCFLLHIQSSRQICQKNSSQLKEELDLRRKRPSERILYQTFFPWKRMTNFPSWELTNQSISKKYVILFIFYVYVFFLNILDNLVKLFYYLYIVVVITIKISLINSQPKISLSTNYYL